MKKSFGKLMLVAMVATTFVACEDVPEPYSIPEATPAEEVTYTGSGTLENPYTCADVIKYVQSLDGEESAVEVYVKGIVAEVTEEFSTQYGNGTFTISDDGTTANVFTAYRVLYLGNQRYSSGKTQIKVGDEVIVYGKVVNYRSNTPETVQGSAFLYSLNGVSEGGASTDEGEPTGSGTLEDPFNSWAAIKYAQELGETESPKEVYIKGKVASITEQYGIQYGNATFTISDDGTATGAFTVYRALYLGNKKYTSGDLLKERDDVIVCGKVVNYRGNTPETVQGSAYLYSLNGVTEGGGNSDPQPGNNDGKGTADTPYNVAAALSAGSGTGVYVKAFIVGSVSGQVLSSGATFSADGDAATNLLIADSSDETNVENCMPVQLPSGAIRTALNLVDNKGNYKKEVTLYGNIEKYFGATGLKSVSFAILDGEEIGTNPGGGNGDSTPSTDVKAVTIDEFNKAEVNANVWYQLTGTVKNLKDNDQYGNFDLEDSTGSVYVYGVLSTKGGEKKKFQELSAEKGIKNGSTLTIIGTRGDYNGKIEVVNAYFVDCK